MRGSPLLRTLIVLAVVLMAGLGLAVLTKPAPIAELPDAAPKPAETVGKRAAYELVLSATAKRVTLEAGGAIVSHENSAGPLAGSLELSNAAILSLKIEWAEDAPGHRFAKLRLEEPGKETREHVFTAPGDIDDIWEP